MGKQFIFAKETASFKMGLVTAGVIRSQSGALWHLSSLAESGRDRANRRKCLREFELLHAADGPTSVASRRCCPAADAWRWLLIPAQEFKTVATHVSTALCRH